MTGHKSTTVGNDWEYEITVYVGNHGVTYTKSWRYA